VADLVPRSSVATAVGVLSAVGGITSVLFNLIAGWLVGSVGYTPLLLVGALLHPLAAVVIWRTYTRKAALQS
jgi:ACS family hexuronate transporter-like MFS transporter